MSGSWILSGLLGLPIIGALLILMPRESEAGKHQRALDRARGRALSLRS